MDGKLLCVVGTLPAVPRKVIFKLI